MTDLEAPVGFMQMVYSDDANNLVVHLCAAMFDSEDELLRGWNSIKNYPGSDQEIFIAVDLYDENHDLIHTKRISIQACEELSGRNAQDLIREGTAKTLADLTILKARLKR